MIIGYEDEITCDLAETYTIYDMYKHPPFFIATLVVGLRNDSRLKKKMADVDYTTIEILIANVLDRLNLLWWAKTTDAERNRNRPESIARKLLKLDKTEDGQTVGFRDSASFEEAWSQINKGD